MEMNPSSGMTKLIPTQLGSRASILAWTVSNPSSVCAKTCSGAKLRRT